MTTTEAKPAASPEDLLKAAVDGKAAPRDSAAAPVAASFRRGLATLKGAEPRLLAVAGGALALGALLGAGATSVATSQDRGSSAAIVSLATAIDSGRGESAKLAKAIAKIEQSVAEMRASSEAARKESGTKNGGVAEKIAQLDRNLSAKLTSLSERVEQAEREQMGRLAAITARPAPAVKAEPTQTGSLAEPRDKTAEAKPVETRQAEARQPEAQQADAAKADTPAKPPVLENLALRDVYEGAAIIENRNRRLFQVMPGDTLPGAGRVEALERRGRTWVLVTRQGLVTPQPW